MISSSHQQPPAVVIAQSATEWRIEVTRALAAHCASARVITTIAPTTANAAPHSAVASALAWLALARSALNAKKSDDAVESARRGIADLGDNYRPKGVKDDTGLHLLETSSMIADGRTAERAKELAAILNTRIDLYFRRYQGEVLRLIP